MNNKNRKTHLKLGKETYGSMPIQECFEKALAPYFDSNGTKYINKLGKDKSK